MNYQKLFPQIVGFVLTVLLLTACNASQPTPASVAVIPTDTPVPPTPTPAPVLIPGTEARTFHSSIVDQDYTIQVALPLSYATSDTKYPVVYTMLGDLYFGLATDTTRALRFEKELRGQGDMPEVIVVGIAYDDPGWGQDFHDKYPTLAFRDMTPTNESWAPGSGQADRFLQFMQEELFPFIETNYRVTSEDRTLIGHSVGGLFTLYAMFQAPDAFNRYIALSPSFGWGNKSIFRYEEEFAQNNTELPVKLFLASGELEPDKIPFVLKEFYQILEDRNYAGLEMEMAIFENETHSSSVPAAMSSGFRSVFP